MCRVRGPLRLSWEYGHAEVQTLGGMLGPVTLRLPDDRELEIMHVAPWAGMTKAGALPGMLQRLRGEWPCVPFGRTDVPTDLPPGWRTHPAQDAWVHGYPANHHWKCIDATPRRVHLAIDYPADSAIERIERVISVAPHAPALDIALSIHARRPALVPAGLHPTFRLPPAPGRVKVILGPHDGVYSYPSSAAGSVSRLLPDTRSETLSALAGIDGPLNLSRLPFNGPTEELMQIRALKGAVGGPPLALHYLDYDACVGLWWDTTELPDLLLWVSNGGRFQFPWMSRHLALGAEPINSLFDLGRVAQAPAGHPLADRLGLALSPDRIWKTQYRLAAWPQKTVNPP
jgi:hypothetical protein